MPFITSGGTAAPFSPEASDTPRKDTKPAPSFIFLRVLLLMMALGAWGEGLRILIGAKSAVHEQLGYTCGVMGAVFFSAACVMEGLRAIAKRIN